MAGLSLEKLSYNYERHAAVRELSLEVGEGEIVCLLGPSGCGKSTTLRLVAGLEPPASGRILIGGELMAGEGVNVPPERRNVGLVFQDYALFPHLNVEDNIAFGLRAGGGSARAARVAELLARVGLSHLAKAYPHTLSGGEQQRVGLARALAPQPRLMLMDEPFSGLDVRLRDQVRDDTLKLLKASGTATLLVTHDPEEAMRMADRIAVMQRGQVVQIGSPTDVYERPQSEFVAKFLSETNELPVTVREGIASSLLGRFPASGLPDGGGLLLFRPEALSLHGAEAAEGVSADILDARSLGAYGLVRLRLGDSGAEILARLPSASLAMLRPQVRVRLDPSRALIFPSKGPA